jgi:hypothetical protein
MLVFFFLRGGVIYLRIFAFRMGFWAVTRWKAVSGCTEECVTCEVRSTDGEGYENEYRIFVRKLLLLEYCHTHTFSVSLILFCVPSVTCDVCRWGFAIILQAFCLTDTDNDKQQGHHQAARNLTARCRLQHQAWQSTDSIQGYNKAIRQQTSLCVRPAHFHTFLQIICCFNSKRCFEIHSILCTFWYDCDVHLNTCFGTWIFGRPIVH